MPSTKMFTMRAGQMPTCLFWNEFHSTLTWILWSLLLIWSLHLQYDYFISLWEAIKVQSFGRAKALRFFLKKKKIYAYILLNLYCFRHIFLWSHSENLFNGIRSILIYIRSFYLPECLFWNLLISRYYIFNSYHECIVTNSISNI